MSDFAESYLGRLRALVGGRLLQTPGARIVIENDDGKVLLQERADFGLWGVPGGNPDDGERIEDAIRRETWEETSLILKACHAYGYGSDPTFELITYPNGDKTHVYCLLFYTTEFEGTATVNDTESLSLDWFDPSHLPDMLPNMARTIEAYVRHKSTGQFQFI